MLLECKLLIKLIIASLCCIIQEKQHKIMHPSLLETLPLVLSREKLEIPLSPYRRRIFKFSSRIHPTPSSFGVKWDVRDAYNTHTDKTEVRFSTL